MSAKIEELKQILLQLLKKESRDIVSEPIIYENSIINTNSIRYTESNNSINKTNPGINQNINPNNIIDNTFNTDRNI